MRGSSSLHVTTLQSLVASFENKKKLAKLNNEKHNFREGTKIFVNESLTPMNEFIPFNCTKLKCKELIHSCYSRNGVLNIKMTDKSWPVKIIYMESLLNLFQILRLRNVPGCISRYWCLCTLNLLTSNAVQWNESSVVLVSWWCLKELSSGQYCVCCSLILMLSIKLVVWWMVWWCYCLYWKVKLIKQTLNSNEFYLSIGQ